MPVRLMKVCQRSTSARMVAMKASEVPPMAMTPSSASRPDTSGLFSTASSSLFMRATISPGMPLGPIMPCHRLKSSVG